MNKLEDLFKKKQEIESEMQAIEMVEQEKKEKVSRAKREEEARAQEWSLDMTYYQNLKSEYFDKIQAIFGEDELTPNQLLFIVSVLMHLMRNQVDSREVMAVLASINRVMKVEAKQSKEGKK